MSTYREDEYWLERRYAIQDRAEELLESDPDEYAHMSEDELYREAELDLIEQNEHYKERNSDTLA